MQKCKMEIKTMEDGLKNLEDVKNFIESAKRLIQATKMREKKKLEILEEGINH